MSYIIGIDGGGTKTHCLLTNLDGSVLHECYGGASQFLVQGIEPVSEILFKLINDCLNAVNINPKEIKIVLLGTTGAGRRTDAERLEQGFANYLAKQKFKLNLFRVESDARIALEGAFSGKPGSILITGTGSIMFGKDAQGNIHRVGGFGRYLGDEGSGYVIGKKGLAAVSKEFDGRGSKTLITVLVKEKFNILSRDILITEIYNNNFDIASAAPLVIEAAEKNDELAMKIIEDETDELLLHISAMQKKLNEKILSVSFIGGIITHKNIYSDTLRKKIEEKLHNVVVKDAENSPAMGAVLMAKQFLEVNSSL
jgi:N-acetylglucosamine kinase-like BadF-type ATPase